MQMKQPGQLAQTGSQVQNPHPSRPRKKICHIPLGFAARVLQMNSKHVPAATGSKDWVGSHKHAANCTIYYITIVFSPHRVNQFNLVFSLVGHLRSCKKCLKHLISSWILLLPRY